MAPSLSQTGRRTKTEEPDKQPEDLAGETESDEPFRIAAMAYELKNKRYPVAKDSGQPGHDIDSWSHPEGNLDRRLIRRIEVKGTRARWQGEAIVELSRRQVKDAMACFVEKGLVRHDDFDYWLYVVELLPDRTRVHAVRNPARRAARFEVPARLWRDDAEKDEAL